MTQEHSVGRQSAISQSNYAKNLMGQPANKRGAGLAYRRATRREAQNAFRDESPSTLLEICVQCRTNKTFSAFDIGHKLLY
jgi:hypothetical protein